MSKNATPAEQERVNPIVTYDAHGEPEYTLDFDADSIAWAENTLGLELSGQTTKPVNQTLNLIFAAFRKNHPTVKKPRAIKIWGEIDFDKENGVEWLGELLAQAIDDISGGEKTRKVGARR
jgi:hypothetical protein